jgi:uroporphyrinogen-III synthase
LSNIEKPLAGKCVVVTRAPEQAQQLKDELERQGAEVLALPTVSFSAAENPEDLDAALRAMDSFDWIVFTSQNAVRYVCERMNQLGVQRGRAQVAAVGLATAGTAKEAGFVVTYIAKNQGGEALASELTTKVAGKSVLLPRSDRAGNALPAMLSAAGAKLTDAVAYRTLTPAEINPEALARVKAGDVDVIVFASPSSFHNLCDAIPVAEMKQMSAKVNFAAIGPTTSRALLDLGMRVAIQSSHASAVSLADAIAKHYARLASVTAEAKGV